MIAVTEVNLFAIDFYGVIIINYPLYNSPEN